MAVRQVRETAVAPPRAEIALLRNFDRPRRKDSTLCMAGRARARSVRYTSSMADRRPRVGIGHVTLRVRNVAKAESFYRAVGMRRIMAREEMAILEMRGGTHLLLFRAKAAPKRRSACPFDLMVDDIPVLRDHLLRVGMKVSGVEHDEERGGHLFFSVKDPDGHLLTIYSSHAGDREV
jgi:catechol 2,3-dioxygenase-like lactoylglutathione lyase family enzyme